MSISSNGSRARFLLASSRSGASASSSFSAGIATILHGSSPEFSTVARPKATLPLSTATRAASGMVLWIFSQPAEWMECAPRCLPSPMASIFVGPLSTVPLNAVCGLTLLTTMTESAS